MVGGEPDDDPPDGIVERIIHLNEEVVRLGAEPAIAAEMLGKYLENLSARIAPGELERLRLYIEEFSRRRNNGSFRPTGLLS